MTCSVLLVDTSGTAGARYAGILRGELSAASEPVPPSLALEAARKLEPEPAAGGGGGALGRGAAAGRAGDV